MSVTKNAIVPIAKIIANHLRCASCQRNGVALTPRQNKIYLDGLELLAFAWYDVLPTAATPAQRWLNQWLPSVVATDVIDFVQTLKFSADWFVQNESVFGNYDTFKQCLRANGGKCDLIAPTKTLVDRWFLYREPDDLRRLRTAFSFLTRLNLPGLDDLEDQAAARYVATDSSLISSFTEEEGLILRKWFPYNDITHIYDEWFPKHGPGSTADAGRSLLGKYQSFAEDSMVRRLDLLIGGNTTTGYNANLKRSSSVVFVPKSIDKLRSICMEPATLQWYQQGFARSIEVYMRNHATLNRRVSLENQEYSRHLAYLGSIDGKFSTIDLSDASDRVPWSLIKSWMRGTCLLPPLWMTRSKRATVAGKVIDQNKFAPMGSALCFPIECIVFCSIVEASIKAVGGPTRDSLYRVYGDDIIVETRYASEVIRRLTRNGFVVNESKSFFLKKSHNFRESCGGEFFDGVDVTPVRISRKFSGLTRGKRTKPSSIAALVDMCNVCYMTLPSVRRRIIWDLMKLPSEFRPVFDHDGEHGIFSVQPTNFHLPKPVYVKRYQQWYLKHGSLQDAGKASRGDERLALYETLRSTYAREKGILPEDTTRVALDRKPRLRWVVTKTPLEQVVNPDDLRGQGDLEE